MSKVQQTSLSSLGKEDPAIRNNKGNYFTIPNCIFDYDLVSRDIAVYCYLKKCAGMSGICYPSVKTIAKATNLSSVTIKKATDALQDAGLINVANRYDGNGQLSNLYTILKI